MKPPVTNPYPPLLPEDYLRRARALSTALLCDGMAGLGLPGDGCMEADILPVSPEMKIAGTACTVKTGNGDNLPIHAALCACQPGYVMVIEAGHCKDRPYIGSLMASTARAVGLQGLVLDGYARDREELIQLGFPVYSNGFMQRGPVKREAGAINVPIFCGGLTVEPGDLIVGDADGVTVVPRGKIEQVLEKAEEKQRYEALRKKEIAEYARLRERGEPLFSLVPDWMKKLFD